MSSTGTSTVTSMVLALRRLDDLDVVRAAEEPGGLVDRADRRGQADALGRAAEQRVEPLEGERQVGAALGGGDRVHLVDDHRLDAAQRLPRGRGEQQEERLGRGDQDVRRGAGEQPPLVGRGVAGAHADGDLRRRDAEPAGGLPDAGQRRPQVALDVDGERLERADVEHPAAALRASAGAGSRASRSSDQRNAARVLPEPVGATTSALRPAPIARHAPAWAAVGAAKAARNHSRVAGPSSASTSCTHHRASGVLTKTGNGR